MKEHVPLIYFHGIVQGKYEAVWPVYIVGDDLVHLTFKVAADELESIQYKIENETTFVSDVENDIRRRYVTTQVRQRIHQHIFRERVLDAYCNQCSFCRLRHPELLDAAHIIGDKEPEGEPVVSNGLSLCKIHHAAFDEMLVGIRPEDYTIEVREDIRKEEDGPMLVHGLQKLHNTEIILPRIIRNRPDQNLLDIKFRRFKQAI
jgi:putative restriction endonuclease